MEVIHLCDESSCMRNEFSTQIEFSHYVWMCVSSQASTQSVDRQMSENGSTPTTCSQPGMNFEMHEKSRKPSQRRQSFFCLPPHWAAAACGNGRTSKFHAREKVERSSESWCVRCYCVDIPHSSGGSCELPRMKSRLGVAIKITKNHQLQPACWLNRNGNLFNGECLHVFNIGGTAWGVQMMPSLRYHVSTYQH